MSLTHPQNWAMGGGAISSHLTGRKTIPHWAKEQRWWPITPGDGRAVGQPRFWVSSEQLPLPQSLEKSREAKRSPMLRPFDCSKGQGALLGLPSRRVPATRQPTLAFDRGASGLSSPLTLPGSRDVEDAPVVLAAPEQRWACMHHQCWVIAHPCCRNKGDRGVLHGGGCLAA